MVKHESSCRTNIACTDVCVESSIGGGSHLVSWCPHDIFLARRVSNLLVELVEYTLFRTAHGSFQLDAPGAYLQDVPKY